MFSSFIFDDTSEGFFIQPLGLLGLSLESCLQRWSVCIATLWECCNCTADHPSLLQQQWIQKAKPAVVWPLFLCSAAHFLGLEMVRGTKFTHEVVGRGCSHISCSEALHLNASAGPQDLISFLQDNKAAVLFSLPDNYYLFFPIVFRIYMLFSFEEQSLCYLPFFCPDYFFVEQLMRGSSAQHMQSCLFPFESTMDVF